MMHSAVLVLLLSLIASIYCVPTTPSLESHFGDFQLADCEKSVCKDDVNRSDRIFTVFHWNHEKQDCEAVKYALCTPSGNLFFYKSLCLTIAKPVCTKKNN